MRVDPFYVQNLSSALDNTQSNIQQLTQEVSSGLAVNTIGSNPVAASQDVQLLNQIQRDDSFTQTGGLTQGLLQVTDSTLGSVVTQLNSAISLATQGSNGTLNASNLKSISNQIAGIRDEVLSLANTSYQGQYVFAGSQSSTPPFTLDTSTSPATVTYNGDSLVNSLTTPSGQKIALNVPGDQIFTNSSASVLGALNNLVADFAGGTTNGAPTDLATLDSALNALGQQRVTIDNSVNQLSAATSFASSESLQLKTVQTNLMQASIPAVSSQLSLNETQQTALVNMIAALGTGSLFDKL